MSYSKSRVKKSTRARCKRHNGGGLISFLGVNSSREPIPHVIISLLSVDPIVVVSLSHRPTKDDYHYPIYRLLFIEHSILLDRFRRFSSYLSCATCSTFRPLMDMCGVFMPDVHAIMVCVAYVPKYHYGDVSSQAWESLNVCNDIVKNIFNKPYYTSNTVRLVCNDVMTYDINVKYDSKPLWPNTHGKHFKRNCSNNNLQLMFHHLH